MTKGSVGSGTSSAKTSNTGETSGANATGGFTGSNTLEGGSATGAATTSDAATKPAETSTTTTTTDTATKPADSASVDGIESSKMGMASKIGLAVGGIAGVGALAGGASMMMGNGVSPPPSSGIPPAPGMGSGVAGAGGATDPLGMLGIGAGGGSRVDDFLGGQGTSPINGSVLPQQGMNIFPQQPGGLSGLPMGGIQSDGNGMAGGQDMLSAALAQVQQNATITNSIKGMASGFYDSVKGGYQPASSGASSMPSGTVDLSELQSLINK